MKETREETYRKVFIKTEDDLPKDKGFYFVHYKHPDERLHTQMSVVYYDDTIKGLWYGKDWYDWYLQPVTAKIEQSQDEQVNEAFRHLGLGVKYKDYNDEEVDLNFMNGIPPTG